MNAVDLVTIVLATTAVITFFVAKTNVEKSKVRVKVKAKK